MQILRPWPLPFQIRVHLPARAACLPATAAQRAAAAAKDARSKWGGTSWGWAGHRELSLILASLLQVFIPFSSESSDEEDEELSALDWALTVALLEEEYPDREREREMFLHEILLTVFSDSD